MAEIYSCNSLVIAKLATVAAKYPDAYKLIAEDEYSKTYSCPKKLIRFGNPPRELTEEEKERTRQMLAKYAFKKKEEQ